MQQHHQERSAGQVGMQVDGVDLGAVPVKDQRGVQRTLAHVLVVHVQVHVRVLHVDLGPVGVGHQGVHPQGDPHDGGRYTVKRYKSVKVATADGLVNALVQLEPLNPEFTRIELTPDDAVDLRVIGEFVCVVADRQVGNGAAQGSSERR